MQILHAIIRVFLAIFCGYHLHIHITHISITHHNISFHNFTGCGLDARGTLGCIIYHDFLDFGAKLNFPANIFEDIHESLNQCTHAAHRKPHAPSLLQNMNQSINGSCLKWIATNKQWMKAEYLTKSVIFDMLIHHTRNRTLRTQ